MKKKTKFNINIFKLLDKKGKIHGLGILVLMVIGGILETLTIGTIPAFIYVLNKPSMIENNSYLKFFSQTFNITNTQHFFVYASLLLISIFIVKNLYLIFLSYLQYKFIFQQKINISYKLFNSYLHSPYTFHIERNPSTLISNLKIEVTTAFREVIIPLMNLTTELIVAFFLTILLIFIEPFATFIAITFLSISILLFYKLIHKKVNLLGKKRQHYSSIIIRRINETFNGIKEIKILRRESFFLNSFIHEIEKLESVAVTIGIINNIPKLFLETVAVSSILTIIIVILIRNQNINSILPIISLFAVVSFRLIPSFNRILLALTSIANGYSSVETLYQDLEYFKKENTTKKTVILTDNELEFSEKIEVKNIFYQYQNTNYYALQNLSLSIFKNQSIGLIGTSGAGKTTLVDIILGLLTPSQGKILVDGKNIDNYLKSWQKKIAYIPQNIYLADDTILGNIAFGISDKDIDNVKVDEAIKTAQLKELIDSLPQGLYTRIGDKGVRLSGGQRQRIGIARAIYCNPEVLIMDEATSALDNETEREFIKALDLLMGKKTIIVIAHRLTTVKNCDCLYLLEKGKIVNNGTYNQLLNSCPRFIKLHGI